MTLCDCIASSSSFSSSSFLASSLQFTVRPPPDLNRDQLCRVFASGPQTRSSALSVGYRNPTAISCAQCSLPDTNHPRPVFATGPQPRSAAPNVRHRTSTTLERISGYRIGKSCEHSHVLKAGLNHCMLWFAAVCKHAWYRQTSYSNVLGHITNTSR